MKNIEKIKKTINQYEIISFDLYDTLLKRLVSNPRDVFDVVERLACEQHIDKAKGFAKRRVLAEQSIRRQSRKEEISINDIYTSLSHYGKEETNRLKGLEIYVEQELTVVNPSIFSLYKYALEKNKRIIIVSDMYLPKEVIIEILEKLGINHYEDIYVSSNMGSTKRHGTIYKEIHNLRNIDYKQWLHIGDNWRADYLIPSLYGIKAIHVPKNLHYLLVMNKPRLSDELSERLLYGTLNHTVSETWNMWERIGYEVYGPILFGFVQWLNNELKIAGIDKVLFLSRDGYLFKKIFDGIRDDVISRYCLVSRRSLILPILSNEIDVTTFFNLVIATFPKTFKLHDVFDYLELDLFLYKTELSNNFIDDDTEFDRDRALHDERFLKMYEIISRGIKQKANDAKAAILSYFSILGVKQNEKIAIVDVGWRGSLQKNIESICGMPIYGYYLGIDKSIFSLCNTSGYLANNKEEVEKFFAFTGLIEGIFSAPHGSVKGYYRNNNGKFKIAFDKYEYMQGASNEIVNGIREGALRFSRRISKNDLLSAFDWAPKVMAGNLTKLGLSPTYDLACNLGDIVFADNGINYLAKPNTILHYIINPTSFSYDFFPSRWKVGFLKRLFGIVFPYAIVYRILKELLKYITYKKRTKADAHNT